MLRSIVVSAVVALISACYHGPNLQTFLPAQGPEGIAAAPRVGKTTVRGELLEVQDTALIVLTDSGKIVLARLSDIDRGVFGQRGGLNLYGHWGRSARRQLRYLSRFPAGMTPKVRARLLAAYGQTEVHVVQ
jgi:hypothetical protein